MLPTAVHSSWASAREEPRLNQRYMPQAGTPRLTPTTAAGTARRGHRHGPRATTGWLRAAPPPTRATSWWRRVRFSTTTMARVRAASTHPSTAAGVRSNEDRYEV